MVRWLFAAACAWWLVLPGAYVRAAETPMAAVEHFRQVVAPVLQLNCLHCHNGQQAEGGLSLATARAALAGGNGGPSIVPRSTDESWLLDMVSGSKPDMPKLGNPLSDEEVAGLRQWIADGAPWPEGLVLQDRRFEDAWWSLTPLVRPPVPTTESAWARTPIDRFILAALERESLTPAPEADRRTLIRRLAFDLHGLPPTPDEVAAFVADRSADAYERLVDRMLASPRYGERWARHWLDVVHYGETHGYDKDKPRPNAWPYRDYVIRSLNQDKPYGQFVQEQIAGDVLFPGTIDGIEALGFIAAGPWDLIGHAEVPESKIDGKIARHLDRDDMVANTIGTFNSLTVHCAQCHDHKFDPISQADYYRLQAVFAALDRADRRYDIDPDVAGRRETLTTEQHKLEQRRDALQATISRQAGAELARLDRLLEQSAEPTAARRPEYGYHSRVASEPDTVKWVQIDLGRTVEIAQIRYVGCFDSYRNIGAGFGFPRRYRIEVSNHPDFAEGVHCVADHTEADVANPGTVPQLVQVNGLPGRYVRMTATRLAPRNQDYIFALDEVMVLDAVGNNLAFRAPVTARDSIEALPRWATRNLTDGIQYADARPSADNLDQLQQQRAELIRTRVDARVVQQLTATRDRLKHLGEELAALPAQQLVYAGTVHHGQGNFLGTGGAGGRPREIRLLHRGDVRDPRQIVEAGALSLLPGLPGEFGLSERHTEGDRRAALAKWLSHADNPLTWRSIANRLWLYHMGRGLVDTPNDFGRMGQLPSHPELLDWLAVELRDSGQSLKHVHRLIVTSAVYRQSSAARDDYLQHDAGNVFYWRMNRRRLEAEALRDSVLYVAGKLDEQMGGPSFQDFVIEKPQHSPHYQYHLHDPDDPRSQRRSVYRFIVRSKQQPLMTVLDCADPSMLVDKRNETISPLQALAQLNNRLMVVMAGHFADRIEQQTPDAGRQAALAVELALGRRATHDEVAALAQYRRQHGLANMCRVILNLNEFVFVD